MKVFYSPHQSVAGNESFSPSAGKPERLLAQWCEFYPIQILEPQPVSEADFCLAHDSVMVRGVAASLPWTTGSLVSAAGYVLEHGGAILDILQRLGVATVEADKFLEELPQITRWERMPIYWIHSEVG